MQSNYLFPNTYKTIGWILLIPALLGGLTITIVEYEPSILDLHWPAVFIDELFGQNKLFGITKNNMLNEIVGVLLIIGLMLVCFSKEKNEDEFISQIRLESLVWATYFNYGILLLAIMFVFDFSFLRVMIYSMFTIPLFFIVRFYWKLSKIKKSLGHEE